MKLVSISAILVMLMNISVFDSSPENSQAISSSQVASLIDQLDAMGYYQYASQKNEIIAESKRSGYIFGDPVTNRAFFCDAENLAEGGVKTFLEDIDPALRLRKVVIKELREEFSEQGYFITINGIKYTIYTEKEFESVDTWELSSIRTFSIINRLLKEAGSTERVYQLYGGNEQLAIFLTPEMYDLIKNAKGLDEIEKPKSIGVLP
ncbi:MAG: hypothetical protein ACM32O_11325 [Clostridia bacterium]